MIQRTAVLLVAATSLGGCQSAGEKAERQYEIVEKSGGTYEELCREAGRVKEAYLRDENTDKFNLWRITETAKCLRAENDRRIGL